MIGSAPRRSGAGEIRRLVAVSATVLVAVLAFVAPAADATPARIAATGGCRSVGSGEVPSGGGPNRATVVVDTGSGPVWSACISFSGSISGIEALERAQSTITDLDPVYDQYTGLGKAVCKLRGVGSSPPDCLGKTVDYWSLSLNGKVTPVGAGAITVKDGDVEGWKYGTGGTPRAATVGTEAAAAPPPTTTTRPATPTTRPPSGTTTPSGGLTGSTKLDGSPADPTTTKPGQTTTTVKGQTTTTAKGATTSTTQADGHTTQLASSDGTEGTDDEGGTGSGSESATGAAAGSGSSASSGDGSGGSSLPAIAGFAVVIAAIGGGAVLIRRRRLGAGSAPAA